MSYSSPTSMCLSSNRKWSCRLLRRGGWVQGIGAGTLTLLLSAATASAALIAYEPFDYPAGSTLSSNAGGFGWSGTWIYSPLIANHGTIIATNLAWGKLAYAGNVLR